MSFRRNTAGKQHGDPNESNKKKLSDYKASMQLKRKSTIDIQKSGGSKKLEEPSDKSSDTKSAKVTKITSPTQRPSPTSSETVSISKRSPTRISDAKTPSTQTTTTPEDPERIEDEKLKEKLSVRLNDSSKEKLLDKEQLQESPFDGLYNATREPFIQDDADSNPCMCQAPNEGGKAVDPENMPESGEDDEEERKLTKNQENELRRHCKEKIKELTEKGDIEVKVINGVKHYYTKDGTLLLKKNCRSGIPRRPVPPVLVSTPTPATIKLTWGKPSEKGNRPVDNYVIEVQDVSTGNWTKVGAVPGSVDPPEFELVGIQEGDSYMFRVYAQNGMGNSGPTYSEQLAVTQVLGLPDPPEGPLNVSSTKKEIFLSWTKPKNTDEKPVNKYIIDVQDPKNKTWHKVGEVDGNVDQPVIRLTQLQPKELCFRVFAQNIAGLSDPLLNSANTVKAKKKKRSVKGALQL